jgi:hypothetical protein
MDSVPTIVPLLDREYRTASLKLHQTVQELGYSFFNITSEVLVFFVSTFLKQGAGRVCRIHILLWCFKIWAFFVRTMCML